MKKQKTKRATNGSGRRMRKPVGHENGKRVAALRHRAETAVDSIEPRSFGRTNVIPSNGDLPTSTEVAPERVPIGEAMRRAVEELGDVKIDQELAPAQLKELGEAYEEVTRRQAAFSAKSDEAKTAKKSLDSATELLLLKVKEFTHPTPLPLFDHTQAENDRTEMVEGAQEIGLNDGAGAEA